MSSIGAISSAVTTTLTRLVAIAKSILLTPLEVATRTLQFIVNNISLLPGLLLVILISILGALLAQFIILKQPEAQTQIDGVWCEIRGTVQEIYNNLNFAKTIYEVFIFPINFIWDILQQVLVEFIVQFFVRTFDLLILITELIFDIRPCAVTEYPLDCPPDESCTVKDLVCELSEYLIFLWQETVVAFTQQVSPSYATILDNIWLKLVECLRLTFGILFRPEICSIPLFPTCTVAPTECPFKRVVCCWCEFIDLIVIDFLGQIFTDIGFSSVYTALRNLIISLQFLLNSLLKLLFNGPTLLPGGGTCMLSTDVFMCNAGITGNVDFFTFGTTNMACSGSSCALNELFCGLNLLITWIGSVFARLFELIVEFFTLPFVAGLINDNIIGACPLGSPNECFHAPLTQCNPVNDLCATTLNVGIFSVCGPTGASPSGGYCTISGGIINPIICIFNANVFPFIETQVIQPIIDFINIDIANIINSIIGVLNSAIGEINNLLGAVFCTGCGSVCGGGCAGCPACVGTAPGFSANLGSVSFGDIPKAPFIPTTSPEFSRRLLSLGGRKLQSHGEGSLFDDDINSCLPITEHNIQQCYKAEYIPRGCEKVLTNWTCYMDAHHGGGDQDMYTTCIAEYALKKTLAQSFNYSQIRQELVELVNMEPKLEANVSCKPILEHPMNLFNNNSEKYEECALVYMATAFLRQGPSPYWLSDLVFKMYDRFYYLQEVIAAFVTGNRRIFHPNYVYNQDSLRHRSYVHQYLVQGFVTHHGVRQEDQVGYNAVKTEPKPEMHTRLQELQEDYEKLRNVTWEQRIVPENTSYAQFAWEKFVDWLGDPNNKYYPIYSHFEDFAEHREQIYTRNYTMWPGVGYVSVDKLSERTAIALLSKQPPQGGASRWSPRARRNRAHQISSFEKNLKATQRVKLWQQSASGDNAYVVSMPGTTTTNYVTVANATFNPRTYIFDPFEFINDVINFVVGIFTTTPTVPADVLGLFNSIFDAIFGTTTEPSFFETAIEALNCTVDKNDYFALRNPTGMYRYLCLPYQLPPTFPDLPSDVDTKLINWALPCLGPVTDCPVPCAAGYQDCPSRGFVDGLSALFWIFESISPAGMDIFRTVVINYFIPYVQFILTPYIFFVNLFIGILNLLTNFLFALPTLPYVQFDGTFIVEVIRQWEGGAPSDPADITCVVLYSPGLPFAFLILLVYLILLTFFIIILRPIFNALTPIPAIFGVTGGRGNVRRLRRTQTRLNTRLQNASGSATNCERKVKQLQSELNKLK